MNTLKSPFNIHSGTFIQGKWHRNTFKILKELGYGANGTVFLAESKYGQVALKISYNGMSIISEVNVLKSFAKVQGYNLGPSLIDVDDWVTNKGTYSFYVMEYIHGPDLLDFIRNKDSSWIQVLMLQLLKDLQVLHEHNWVFGDLKPENLIINGPPTRIRCIDVGGTTINGRAIKEFTEFYDRGYWGLGTRKAEPSYDLFAVGMIMMNIAYPSRFNKAEGGIKQLQHMINQKSELKAYETILLNAFNGKYYQAVEMRRDIIQLTISDSSSSGVFTSPRQKYRSNQIQSNTTASKPLSGQKNTQITRTTWMKRKKKTGMIESLLLVILISFLYFLYLLGQLA